MMSVHRLIKLPKAGNPLETCTAGGQKGSKRVLKLCGFTLFLDASIAIKPHLLKPLLAFLNLIRPGAAIRQASPERLLQRAFPAWKTHSWMWCNCGLADSACVGVLDFQGL